MAVEAALAKDDQRSFFIGAIGIRKDGAIVRAANSPTSVPNRKIHAEYKLSKKIDCGATVFVARIKFDTNEYGLAKPCFPCLKVLTHSRVKKIYYTISKNEYGVILIG